MSPRSLLVLLWLVALCPAGLRAAEGGPRLDFAGPRILIVDLMDGTIVRGSLVPAPPGGWVDGGVVRDPDGHRIGLAMDGGEVLAFDRIEPSPIRPALARGDLDRPAAWSVRVDGAPARVAGVWRRSAPQMQARAARGRAFASRHVIALTLDAALAPDAVVAATPPGMEAPIIARFEARRPTEAVQTSQIGYEPGQSKRAHVGLWLGWSADGAPLTTDAALRGALAWRVETVEGRPTGISGVLRLERRGDAVDLLADGARATTGYDLHHADFSALTTPGVYRLIVEGFGASSPFELRAGAHLDVLRTVIRGLFHTRRGHAHGPPHTDWRRPAIMLRPHRRSAARIVDSSEGLGGVDKFRLLAEAPWSGAVTPAYGWQDAGDYDTRPQHLLAARALMRVGALFPRVAALDLHLPESGLPYDRVIGGVRRVGSRPLPDYLHEALWAVDHWRDAQRPDGGVPGGYELSQYTGWLPHLGWAPLAGIEAYEYAPDAWAGYAYAAAAAMAARLIGQAGDPDLAADYAASARAAYAWARAEEGALDARQRAAAVFLDDRADAAVQLFALTGDAAYERDFLGTPGHDDVATRMDAAFDYWLMARRGVFAGAPRTLAAIAASLRAGPDLLRDAGLDFYGARRLADERWRYVSAIAQPRATFRALRFAHLAPELFSAAERTTIEGWIERDVLFGLGANPVNMTTITGVGRRPPADVLFADLKGLGDQGPPPGLPLFGPVPAEAIAGRRMARFYAAGGWPPRMDDLPLPFLWMSCACFPLMAEWTPQDTIRQWVWALAIIDALEAARQGAPGG